MIIYNVTIKVTHSIHTNWLQWMKTEHISEMIATGCFTHATILRLMEVDENDGPTYAIQFHAESKALYNKYIADYAPAIRQRSFEKWGDQFIAFRSAMQIVN